MIRSASSLFAVALVSLGIISGTARAQSGPIGPVGPVNPPNTAMQPTGSQTLTEQTMPQMLQAAGYQFQEVVGNSGAKIWRLNLMQNGWRFDISLELIKVNGQYRGYGLSSQLTKLDANPSVAAAQMEKLLAHNFSFTNYRFALDKSSRMLVLVQDIYDTNMTVQLLRQDLVNFMNEIQRLYPIWNPAAGLQPNVQPNVQPHVQPPVNVQPNPQPLNPQPLFNPNPGVNSLNPAPQTILPGPQGAVTQPVVWMEG